jgi:hypothetical protein
MSLSFFSRKKEELFPPGQMSSTQQMSSPSPWASASSPSPWVNKSTPTQQKPTSYFPKPAWQTPITPKKSAFTPQPQQKPAFQAPKVPTPLNPNYTPQKQQQQQQADPMADYLNKIRAIAEQRKGLQTNNANEQQAFMDAVQARNQQRLLEQQERVTGARDRSVNSMKGYIDDITARAEQDRLMAADESGAAQKKSIQAGREEQARLQNLFGDLGSIDSSVFQDQAIKAEQRGTERFRDIEQAKIQKIDEIDRITRANLAEAESSLYDIETNFTDQLAYINDTLVQGSEQHKLAVSELWRNTQDAILQISDNVAQIEMEAERQKAEVNANQLSEGFITTGQPQNRADYEWILNNKDEYDKFGAGSEKERAKQDVVSLIDNFGKLNLSPLENQIGARTGISTFMGEGQEVLGQLELIRNKLLVEKRGDLKGQGQVSDRETDMLADSIMAWKPGMSVETLKSELQQLKNILSGATRYEGGQSSNFVTAPDGQQIILVD